jgi:hypothetical protein
MKHKPHFSEDQYCFFNERFNYRAECCCSWQRNEIYLWTAATKGLLFVPHIIYYYGDSHSGMILTGENRRTWRKPRPVPICPPQIPQVLTGARTRASGIRGLRITDWAMARSRWNGKLQDVYELGIPVLKFHEKWSVCACHAKYAAIILCTHLRR